MRNQFLILAAILSWSVRSDGAGLATAPGAFGADVVLLEKHTFVVLLSDASGLARVAVAPDWQDRVMTSTDDGGVVNSYSDDGKLGAFYELESASPALDLVPGASAEHVQRTFHIRGTASAPGRITCTVLEVGLDTVSAPISTKRFSSEEYNERHRT